MAGDVRADWGARLSRDRMYRFRLWRVWNPAGPVVLWLLLNPSTADARINDATIERCCQRARREGYGSLWVANLFALRARDPGELRRHSAPIGRGNDRAIRAMAAQADRVVCAWGNHGRYLGRNQDVQALLARTGCHPHILGLTRQGQPRHPLYVPYDREPRPWDSPET